jgi:hypothetical protein
MPDHSSCLKRRAMGYSRWSYWEGRRMWMLPDDILFVYSSCCVVFSKRQSLLIVVLLEVLIQICNVISRKVEQSACAMEWTMAIFGRSLILGPPAQPRLTFRPTNLVAQGSTCLQSQPTIVCREISAYLVAGEGVTRRWVVAVGMALWWRSLG